MGEIRDLIVKTYIKKGLRPSGVPALPEDKQAAPAPIRVDPPKTVGNISIAMQAQRIFNPNLPPAPAMKTPPAKMQDTGTAPAMDLDPSFLGKK